jgi:hypothetical protein
MARGVVDLELPVRRAVRGAAEIEPVAVVELLRRARQPRQAGEGLAMGEDRNGVALCDLCERADVVGVVVGRQDPADPPALGHPLVDDLEEARALGRLPGGGIDDVDLALADEIAVGRRRRRQGRRREGRDEDPRGLAHGVEPSRLDAPAFFADRRQALSEGAALEEADQEEHRRRDQELASAPGVKELVGAEEAPVLEVPREDAGNLALREHGVEEAGVEAFQAERWRRHGREELQPGTGTAPSADQRAPGSHFLGKERAADREELGGACPGLPLADEHPGLFEQLAACAERASLGVAIIGAVRARGALGFRSIVGVDDSAGKGPIPAEESEQPGTQDEIDLERRTIPAREQDGGGRSRRLHLPLSVALVRGR